MKPPDPLYDLLEERLAAWAAAQADVRAVLIIGSRARPVHSADAYSDLDTIFFVDDASAWVRDTRWQASLETALAVPAWFAAYSLTGGTGDPEWEWVLESGRKVDVVACSNQAPGGPQASLAEMIAASPYAFVIDRGGRVLVNKQPGAVPVLSPTLPEQDLPDAVEFTNRVHNALLELVRAARANQRGEYWRAAHMMNDDFQESALILLEWQARSAQPPRTAWHYGRFLENWASPQFLPGLADTHARPSAESVRAAVFAGAGLLERLAEQLGGQLGFPVPPAVLTTTTWLRETLRQPSAAG